MYIQDHRLSDLSTNALPSTCPIKVYFYTIFRAHATRTTLKRFFFFMFFYHRDYTAVGHMPRCFDTSFRLILRSKLYAFTMQYERTNLIYNSEVVINDYKRLLIIVTTIAICLICWDFFRRYVACDTWWLRRGAAMATAQQYRMIQY